MTITQPIFESNPFKAYVDHIILLFKHNPIPVFISVGLYFAGIVGAVILGIVGVIAIAALAPQPENSVSATFVIFAVFLALLFLIPVIAYYLWLYNLVVIIDNASAHGQTKSLGSAARPAFTVVTRQIGLNLISGILMLLGFLLLVIPGIYIMVRLSLASYILVVEDTTVRTAISRSWRMTKGHFAEVFSVMMLSGIAALNGAVVYPLIVAATGARYHGLKQVAESPSHQPVNTINYVVVAVGMVLYAIYFGFQVLALMQNSDSQSSLLIINPALLGV